MGIRGKERVSMFCHTGKCKGSGQTNPTELQIKKDNWNRVLTYHTILICYYTCKAEPRNKDPIHLPFWHSNQPSRILPANFLHECWVYFAAILLLTANVRWLILGNITFMLMIPHQSPQNQGALELSPDA